MTRASPSSTMKRVVTPSASRLHRAALDHSAQTHRLVRRSPCRRRHRRACRNKRRDPSGPTSRAGRRPAPRNDARMTSTRRWCFGRAIICGVSARRRRPPPCAWSYRPSAAGPTVAISCNGIGSSDEGPMVHSAAARRIRASTFASASSARMRISTAAPNRQVKPSAASGSGHRIELSMLEPDDADALPLMKRAPPQNGIMDDRQVDRPDEPEQGSDSPLASSFLLRSGQRDVAEIEEEQDQHRRQPAIPFPPGAPGRTTPDRAGEQANGGEGRSCGCKRSALRRPQADAARRAARSKPPRCLPSRPFPARRRARGRT